MLYREAGQFKTTYAEDMAIFPIRQDRIALAILLGIAFIGVPLLATFHIWPFGSDHLHFCEHDSQANQYGEAEVHLALPPLFPPGFGNTLVRLAQACH